MKATVLKRITKIKHVQNKSVLSWNNLNTGKKIQTYIYI